MSLRGNLPLPDSRGNTQKCVLQTARGPERLGRAKLIGALGVFSLRAEGLGGGQCVAFALGDRERARGMTWTEPEESRNLSRVLS